VKPSTPVFLHHGQFSSISKLWLEAVFDRRAAPGGDPGNSASQHEFASLEQSSDSARDIRTAITDEGSALVHTDGVNHAFGTVAGQPHLRAGGVNDHRPPLVSHFVLK